MESVAIAQSMSRPAPYGEALLFQAQMQPHRSLGRKGFLILMAVSGGLSAVAGLIFYLRGAWPVVGFCGLDTLLLYVAFRLSYRQARYRETIELDADQLIVRRALPGGRVDTWQFEPYWVRVQMDDPPQRDSQFALSSHGRRLVLGRFLSPRERLAVANDLRAALRQRDMALNPALA